MASISPPPRRLDPCPCGSGKRYRDCHGSLAASAPPPDPDFTAAVALRAAGDVDAALAQVERKLRETPADATFLNLKGLLLQDRLELPGAIAAFDAAIAAVPAFPEAHYNLALALLLAGDYARGWDEYEWRTRVPGYGDYSNYPFGIPRWKGEPLAGRSLLVHAEQGHGDTIQFARFLAPLAAHGATIDVFCHPPLVELMARMPGVHRAFDTLDERPAQDFHAPIVDAAAAQLPSRDAPHWFGPYVTPDAEATAALGAQLAGARRPLIGISWKGSPRHANDRIRSLSREQATRLVRGDATFVNLQLAEAPLSPAMLQLGPATSDWAGTAALLGHLDLVVTVDTAIGHLAGAMGKPVFDLLSFSPDWRWGVSGEATPWYPSMRLFRQSRRGEWDPVIDRVASAYPR